jgi:hypothetical protein
LFGRAQTIAATSIDGSGQPILTPKQEAACQAFIECGGNQSEAYRRAYDAERMPPEQIWTEASLLFSNPKVAKRVISLQAEHRERHMVTVDTITQELDEARELARKIEQPASMTGATMGKAKVHGLVTDKQSVTHGGRIEFDIDSVFNVTANTD